MKKRLLLVVGLGLLCTLAMVGVALGTVPANVECLDCHSVEFEVGSVDYTSCNACHWIPEHPVGHNLSRQCSDCHTEWPQRVDFYYPTFDAGASGFFTSADSVGLDSGTLHAIHVDGSWPQIIESTIYKTPTTFCASCHAPAACEACHSEGIEHGLHTEPTDGIDEYPPVDYLAAFGAHEGVGFVDERVDTDSRCVNDACHPSDGAVRFSEIRRYEHDDVLATMTGGWTTFSRTAASADTLAKMSPGAEFSCVVEGPAIVRVVGYTFLYGGSAEVSVDEAQPIVVSTYSPLSQWNAPFAEFEITEGEHDISLRVTSGYVYFDYVQLLDQPWVAEDFVPECLSCHGDDEDHFLLHDASAVTNSGCTSCHDMNLVTEHAKDTVSGSESGCDLCHGSDVDQAVADAIVAGDLRCATCHMDGFHSNRGGSPGKR